MPGRASATAKERESQIRGLEVSGVWVDEIGSWQPPPPAGKPTPAERARNLAALIDLCESHAQTRDRDQKAPSIRLLMGYRKLGRRNLTLMRIRAGAAAHTEIIGTMQKMPGSLVVHTVWGAQVLFDHALGDNEILLEDQHGGTLSI